MKVSFISIDDEKNKINFTSDVLYIDNIYRFNDGSTQNTTIELEIIGECVRLTRTGDINMYMLFDLNNITCGSYENNEGLEFDFEIKTCLEIILSNATTNKEPIGQYALLLLKAKNKFDLYNENKEYTFDEDKNTIDEIKNIYNLLHSYPEEFWEVQKDNLFEELNSTKKRKIACINLISELKMDYATNELLNMLNEDESIISVAILALSGFGAINTIKNKEEILEKINNPNLKAMIEEIFKTN